MRQQKQRDRYPTTVQAGAYANITVLNYRNEVTVSQVRVLGINKRRGEATIQSGRSEQRVPLASLSPISTQENGPQRPGVLPDHTIAKRWKWMR